MFLGLRVPLNTLEAGNNKKPHTVPLMTSYSMRPNILKLRSMILKPVH